MTIVDKKTGKRIYSTDADLKNHKSLLKESDPVYVNAFKDDDSEELSPMNPPDAYDLTRTLNVEDENYSDVLKSFIDDHSEVLQKLEIFEKSLISFKENNFVFTEDINKSFNEFFVYFDDCILPHNKKEERGLFDLLHRKLIETGELRNPENPETAVDVMEDDHVKFIQLATLTFNFLGLASRLNDNQSKTLTFDVAYNSGIELVELMKLHIFRENQTLFPLAHKLLTNKDFQSILDKEK